LSVKWLLVTYVSPAFQAPQGHVRSRAAWTAAQFAPTISQDAQFSQQVVNEVMQLLRDSDFAVRFQAAVSLRHLIYDSDQGVPRPSVLPIIQAVLPQLLDELFKLMDEIGNDELVATLEVLIESFSEHMGPYAQGLCQRLADHFIRLALTEDGQEGEEEASFAAVQCCSAITTLLESIKKTPELYPHLEPFLVPMLQRILTPDANGDYQCMEFMEDGLEILTYLTYYAPQISALVWSLFAPLCKSFHDWVLFLKRPPHHSELCTVSCAQ
jgi:importin-7